jgi:GAF domain-containing protein
MTQDDSSVGSEQIAAESVLEVASVAGASISTLGGLLGSETLSASDDVIARVDELQFDLGEGPCWDAIATGRPVLEPDLRRHPIHNWPAFLQAVPENEVAALFAVPLSVGPLRLGAIDMYDVRPRPLDDGELARTVALAAEMSRIVLRQAIEQGGIDVAPSAVRPRSRRRVHQATGFVIAQLDVSAADAELLIQARAFAEGRSMLEVADDILTRRRRFTVRGGEIEDER